METKKRTVTVRGKDYVIRTLTSEEVDSIVAMLGVGEKTKAYYKLISTSMVEPPLSEKDAPKQDRAFLDDMAQEIQDFNLEHMGYVQQNKEPPKGLIV